MTLSISWSLAAVLCGVTGLVVAVAQFFRPDSRIQKRIQERASRTAASSAAKDGKTGQYPVPGVWGEKLVAAWLPRAHQTARLRQRLTYAGYNSATAVVTFVSVQLALMLLLGAGTGWLAGSNRSTDIDWRPAACIGGALGYLLPTAWLHRRKRIRLRKLHRSLPDLLDLMVSCLDAGLSLEAVIQRIADEKNFGHVELSAELRLVQSEIELGATADRAFQSFADRTGSEDVRALSVVCFQSRKYGAKISSTLRTHADLLREQREQQAEEAAQKAAVKILAPTLLCLFPVIFIVLAGPAAIQINENLTSQSDSPPPAGN